MGHPALVACAAIYDTPEDCANEVPYIHKRGYPVVGVEVGEECDGKHMTPEDYGAIYIQVADAVHKLTPGARLVLPASIVFHVSSSVVIATKRSRPQHRHCSRIRDA